MNINELENKSRELFENEKTAVNTDQLWSVIEDQLPQSKRKLGYRRWMLLGLYFLLFGIVSGYAVINWVESKSVSITTDTTLLQQSLDDTNSSSTIAEGKKNDFDNKAIYSTDKSTLKIKTGESTIKKQFLEGIDRSQKAIAQSDTEKSEHTAKTSASRGQLNTTTAENLYSPNSGTFKNTSASYAVNRHNSKIRQSVIGNEKGDVNDYSFTSSHSDLLSSRNSYDQSPFTSSSSNPNGHFIRNNDANESQTSNEYAFSNSFLEIIDIQPLTRDASLRSILFDAPQKPFWIDNEPTFFISLNASVILGHGQLSLQNEDWSDHYNNRKVAESSLPSYSFDLNLGYMINDHLSVSAGIAHTSLFTRSSAMTNSIEDIMLDDVVIQEIIGTNGTSQVVGSAQGQRITTSTVSRINKISTLHIPLSISFHQELGALNATFSFGGRYAISGKRAGYIHPINGEEYNLNIDPEGWYTGANPHFATFGLGLSYPLSDIFSLSAGTMYMHELNSLTTTDYGISESLSNTSFQTGINVKF